jgi:uncharacterized protein (DUF433 family)
LRVQRDELLKRITFNPDIYGGKAIIRGHRLAVQHVLEMLAAGDTAQSLVDEYGWLEIEDVQACLVYGASLAGNEYFEPAMTISETADR